MNLDRISKLLKDMVACMYVRFEEKYVRRSRKNIPGNFDDV